MHWFIIFLFFLSLFLLYKDRKTSRTEIDDSTTLDKEKEFDEITDELSVWEENLELKESELKKKEKRLKNKERNLSKREEELKEQEEEIKKTAKKRRKERLDDMYYFEHFDITKSAFNDAVKNLDYKIIKSFIRKLHKKSKEYYSEGRNGAKHNIQHKGKVKSIDSNKIYELYFGPGKNGRAYFRRRKKQNGYLILKIGKKANQKEDIAWIEKTYNGTDLL